MICCQICSSALLLTLNVSDVVCPVPRSVLEETWREVALAQLTTIIDLTFLDGVLAPDKPSKRQQQHHNLIISNIVAKNWHLPITQSVFNINEVGVEESVLQAAVGCIECLPKGGLAFIITPPHKM